MLRKRPKAIRRTSVGLIALLAVAAAAYLLFGYFGASPFAFREPGSHRPRYPLAAIYWSGDMGYHLGVGPGIIGHLVAHGIPVLAVNSPSFFASARDRPYADEAMALSLSEAIRRSGAARVALIGNSFGADMIGASLGSVPSQLRQRIASVVMVVPGTKVFFHADPSTLSYLGSSQTDPGRTIPQLVGLPVTCVYGTDESDSLCRSPVMRRAHLVGLPGGHTLLSSRNALYRTVERAVMTPPLPMGPLP